LVFAPESHYVCSWDCRTHAIIPAKQSARRSSVQAGSLPPMTSHDDTKDSRGCTSFQWLLSGMRPKSMIPAPHPAHPLGGLSRHLPSGPVPFRRPKARLTGKARSRELRAPRALKNIYWNPVLLSDAAQSHTTDQALPRNSPQTHHKNTTPKERFSQKPHQKHREIALFTTKCARIFFLEKLTRNLGIVPYAKDMEIF
jgi:hypothetical protein